MQKLIEGNKRFIQGDYNREALIASQAPCCAVLACADSRVAPELIFDQGLGELFVVRNAGNVASSGMLESLDFAVNVLNVPLIVVMGHQNCGAVQAVMLHKGDKELGTIGASIQPSTVGKSTLKEAAIANVLAQMRVIQSDPRLREKLESKQLQVQGAYYQFDSGKVEFFDSQGKIFQPL